MSLLKIFKSSDKFGVCGSTFAFINSVRTSLITLHTLNMLVLQGYIAPLLRVRTLFKNKKSRTSLSRRILMFLNFFFVFLLIFILRSPNEHNPSRSILGRINKKVGFEAERIIEHEYKEIMSPYFFYRIRNFKQAGNQDFISV